MFDAVNYYILLSHIEQPVTVTFKKHTKKVKSKLPKGQEDDVAHVQSNRTTDVYLRHTNLCAPTTTKWQSIQRAENASLPTITPRN